MAPTSAAMELKVLISILQSGTALQTMLAQVTQLSDALVKLQTQVNAGATGTAQVGQAGQQAAAGINATSQAVSNLNPQFDTLAAVMTRMSGALKFLAGGFLALRGVQFFKHIADEAARTEVLNTVLHIVAMNAGVTAERIDGIVQSVQRLGITAQASRESLTKFIQAGLAPEGAKELAQAAQNLAVISGRDSSETFRRLIINIQQLDTMGLRFQGIIVNRMEANQKYKQSHTEITRELNRREMQEALLAEVIDKARSLEGAYEAAMGNVGKQITSLTRYYQDLRSEIGKHLLPAYSAFISELSLFLAKMQDQAILSANNASLAVRLGEAVRWMSRQFFDSIGFMIRHREVLYSLIAAYGVYWLLISRPWLTVLRKLNTEVTSAIVNTTNQIKTATAATWSWVFAMRELQLRRPVGPALQRGTQEQGALDFGVPGAPIFVGKGTQPAQGGFFARIGKYLYDLLHLDKVILGLQRTWQFFGMAVRVVGGFFTGFTGTVLLLVAGLGAMVAITAKYTDLGPQLSRTFGQLGSILRGLGTFISNVFSASWKVLGNVLDDTWGVVTGLTHGFGTLMQVMEEIPASPVALWIDAFKGLNIALDKVNAGLNEVNAGLEKAFALAPERLNREFKRITDDLGPARAKVTNAEVAYVAAKNEGIQTKVVAAKTEYDAAKTELKKLEEARNLVIAEMKKIDPARAKVLADQAAANDRRQKADQVATAANEAAAKMRVRVLEGKVEPTEFLEQLSGLDSLIEHYESVRLTSADQIRELRLKRPENEEQRRDIAADILQAQNASEDARIRAIEKAKEIIPAVGAPGTEASFLTRLEKMRAFATEKERLSLDVMTRTAGIQTTEYLEPILVRDLAIRKSAYEKERSSLQTHLDGQLDAIRTANEMQSALDQEYLDTRRMTREEFAASRRAAQEREFAAERAAIEATLETAIGEQRFARTFEEQVSAIRGVETAQQQVDKVRSQQAAKQSALGITERKEARDHAARMASFTKELIDLYGTQSQAVAAVRAEIQRQADELQILGDKEGERATRAKELIEVDKVNAEYQQRAVAREMDIIEGRRAAIGVEQSLLDIEKEAAKIQELRGGLTEAEGMRLRNSIQLKQIEIDRKKMAEDQAELTLKTLAYEQRLLAVAALMAQLEAEEMAGLRTGPESDAARDAYVRELAAARKEIEALQIAVVNANTAIETATASLEFYGKRITDQFVSSFANAMATTVTDFKKAGDAWINIGKSVTNELVSIFGRNLAQRISRAFNLERGFNALLDMIFGKGGDNLASILGSLASSGGGSGSAPSDFAALPINAVSTRSILWRAAGGPVSGPGTGTSDSIPAMLSAGEHIMPADKAARWMPLLEGIRLGRLAPAFALGGVVSLQSIAMGPVIPRRYAGGGVVTDGGSSVVTPGGGGGGHLIVSLHPEALNMSMREWLEHEVVRQKGRR